MVTREAMVSAIEENCRAITANDKRAWLKIWADDAVVEDPAGVSKYVGLEVVGSAFWAQIEAIAPINLSLEREVFACGHEAIAILNAEVQSGSERKKVAPIVDHFIFNAAGKISQMRAFWKCE